MYKYQKLNSAIDLSQDDVLIKTLLRIPDEPCIYIGDYQVNKVVLDNTIEFMNSIKEFYEEWGVSNDLVNMPKKQLFYTDGMRGDFRIMPCSIDSGKRIKSVKVIGTNEENRYIKDKICVGKSMLIDTHDNHIYAILDVCSLSSYRTAAISVLAFSLFMRGDKTNIGLIGLGRIGFYTAYILHNWLGISEFVCHDVSNNSVNVFKQLAEIYMPEAIFEISNKNVLLEKSNSVFIATDSKQEILYKENSKHIDFISSVGADADNLTELSETILMNGHRLVTDSLHSLTLGDMSVWEKAGLISESDVSELKDVINRKPFKDSEQVLFISTGIAVQDALIGKFITDKVLGENL